MSSQPATIVLGSPVLFLLYECSGRHLGYMCKGGKYCTGYARVASSLSLAAHKGKTDDQPHILVSDENLLGFLKSVETCCGFQVAHPKNFRGCEASVVIAVNVSDEWLLEVISRSRTQLIIIDTLPNHQDLWESMRQEERVDARTGYFPDGIEDRRSLLSLDEKKFLWTPTWDKVGERIGEEAVKKAGVLDKNTGKILCFTPEDLDSILLLSSSLTPFDAWGYAWGGNPGEALQTEERKEIIKNLELQGVDWEPKHRPPVALKIRSKGVGLLESLSVSLTGSLLHLPLLKVGAQLNFEIPGETSLQMCLQKRIEDEDHSNLPVSKGSDAGSMSNGELESNISDTLLHQIQLAANIFKRSIVLIGDGLSCTFRPEDEGDGEVDYRGILLFARRNLQSKPDDSPPPISILPIVPHCNELGPLKTSSLLRHFHELGPVATATFRSSFNKLTETEAWYLLERFCTYNVRKTALDPIYFLACYHIFFPFYRDEVGPEETRKLVDSIEEFGQEEICELVRALEKLDSDEAGNLLESLGKLEPEERVHLVDSFCKDDVRPIRPRRDAFLRSFVYRVRLLSFPDKLGEYETRKLLESYNGLGPEERRKLVDSFGKDDIHSARRQIARASLLRYDAISSSLPFPDEFRPEERHELVPSLRPEEKRRLVDAFGKDGFRPTTLHSHFPLPSWCDRSPFLSRKSRTGGKRTAHRFVGETRGIRDMEPLAKFQ
ncbi:unnamed protein product [Darwinula stevensoni]|uniref:Uncharacterized protein n=1 Tax=Darwinula stevensoni TaxID=69355 RepID=A0A7R9AA54_9CRUS|nr:unnamed protein product [Darwinula stevensoni]CAG0898066.1 unnamed protein product [Darwinula stevensoni]